MLFWKDYPLKPIYFKAERTEEELVHFLQNNAGQDNSKSIEDPLNLSPYRRIQEKVVIYKGSKGSQNYQHLTLAYNRDIFFSWTMVPSAEESILVGPKKLNGHNLTFDELETTIAM